MKRARNVLRALRSRKKLTAGLIILLFVILVGVFSGEICDLIGQGQNPISIGFGPRFAPSTWATPLGTDEYGRDILALTVTGLWTSLKVGFYAGVLSTLIGVTIAFFAAYRGGFDGLHPEDGYGYIPGRPRACPCSSPSPGLPRA